MTIRMFLTSGAVMASLMLAACNRADASAEPNAAAELANMGDLNAEDERDAATSNGLVDNDAATSNALVNGDDMVAGNAIGG